MITGFFIIWESENSKEDSMGVIFRKFSLLSLKKYKTIQRRTLLASEELRYTFFVLSQQGPKKGVNYHPINAPSKEIT